MSDIAFSVIVNNNGIDDIVFKTIMLKGDKGNSVDHVEKTSTSGLVDTYTIYLTDGTIGGTFTVTNGAPVNIDDTVTAIDKTWSSNKLSGMIKSIDDNVVDADKLWSSQKINSMLAQTGTIEDVAIASFSDGADDLPLSELTVDIEAWQEGSGEPSPDNERAIHGWNKCNIIKSNTNLWDEQWELGSISSTTGENQNESNCIRSKNYIPVIAGGSYYFKAPTDWSARTVRGRAYDANKSYIGALSFNINGVFTIPSNCYYFRFATPSGATVTTYNNDISINYPATDTSYHAHDGGVDTIEWAVNQWDEQWELGSIDADTGASVPSDSTIRSKNYIPVVENTTYYTKTAGVAMPIFFYDKDKNYLSRVTKTNATFTTPANACFIRFRMATDYGTTYNNDISINYPADDTAYHAYTGIGMIFGASLNVLTGLIIVTHAGAVYDGSNDENWSYYSVTEGNMFRTRATGKNYNILEDNTLCNKYKPVYTNSRTNLTLSGSGNYLDFINDDYSDVTSWRAYLANNNIQVVYMLETPIEIQLTPVEVKTLLNANNIYADTGNVDKIVYFKIGSEAVARMIEAYMRAQPEE